jgi:DNA-directed RNA polymerase subunit RPC12/RpoP
MVANFLHSEKTLPPDELMERDGPNCAACGKRMSISKVETQVSDAGIRSKRTYDCIYCGVKETVIFEKDRQ